MVISESCPHLSHHAVPGPVNLLAMFAVSNQIQVISELDGFRNLFQDVDAEAFAAAFYINARITSVIAAIWYKEGSRENTWEVTICRRRQTKAGKSRFDTNYLWINSSSYSA